MVQLANIEGQLRASSIRRLAELVDKHPDESLSIVRGLDAAGARADGHTPDDYRAAERRAEGGGADAGARRGPVRAACSA